MRRVDVAIIGQGIAGTTLAWQLMWRGAKILIIDRGATLTCSRIAAGLVTPVTGLRAALSWRIDELWDVAAAFYSRVETTVNQRVFHHCEMVRLFADAQEQQSFVDRRTRLGAWVRDEISPPVSSAHFEAPSGGFSMPVGGRLYVPHFLALSCSWFHQNGAFLEEDLDTRNELEIHTDWVGLPRLGVRADYVVDCTGPEAAGAPSFAGLRFNLAKGEMITIHAPRLSEQRIVHAGVWLMPFGDCLFRVGATYDRMSPNSEPTPGGREELVEKVRRVLKTPFTVRGHSAGVRPLLAVRKPVVGPLPAQPRLMAFNGLGSKGVLQAPWAAQQLADLLVSGTPVDPEVDTLRRWRTQ